MNADREIARTGEEAAEMPKLAPEIKIPKQIKAELKEGLGRVVKAIKEEKPDLIIFLQRSGSLFRPAVEAVIGVDHPPIIEANIGREISGEYTNQRINEDLNFLVGDGKNPVELDKLISAHQEDYKAWLRSGGNERIKHYLEKIITKIEDDVRRAKVERVKKVLVVDDSSFEGNTLNFTAPTLINEALQAMALGGKIEVISAEILRNQYWHSSILEETFGQLEKAEKLFLMELAKGKLEISELEKSDGLSEMTRSQRQEGNLMKIETIDELRFLGMYIAEREGVDNPLEGLLERFGERYLLKFSGKVIDALRSASLLKGDLG